MSPLELDLVGRIFGALFAVAFIIMGCVQLDHAFDGRICKIISGCLSMGIGLAFAVCVMVYKAP